MTIKTKARASKSKRGAYLANSRRIRRTSERRMSLVSEQRVEREPFAARINPIHQGYN